MTPCEEKGYKVGDRFRFVGENHYKFSQPERIKLVVDDGTTCPKFSTMDEVLSAFCDLSDVEPLTPQWRGEGRPPVGTHCEAKYNLKSQWFECVVIPPQNKLAVEYNGDWYIADIGEDTEFRPMQSDRDRAIEEMTEIAGRVHGPTARDLAEELYRHGYRKTEGES